MMQQSMPGAPRSQQNQAMMSNMMNAGGQNPAMMNPNNMMPGGPTNPNMVPGVGAQQNPNMMPGPGGQQSSNMMAGMMPGQGQQQPGQVGVCHQSSFGDCMAYLVLTCKCVTQM